MQKQLTLTLDFVKGELQKKYHHLLANKRAVTAEVFKNEYLGYQAFRKTLKDIFTYHNVKMHEKAKAGKCSPKTALRFDITYNKVESFLNYQYKLSDKPLGICHKCGRSMKCRVHELCRLCLELTTGL